jgi:hypothetical protein
MADKGPFPHCRLCNLSFKDRRARFSHFYTDRHKKAQKAANNAGSQQPKGRNMSRGITVPARTAQDIAALAPMDVIRDEDDDASMRYHCSICNMAFPDQRGLHNHT